MNIQIITDSTTDLSKKWIEQYQIETLPLRITMNHQEFLDGNTIDTKKVYEYMRKGVIPKTSQVSLLDFTQCFEKHAEKGQDMIFISFSSKLSGTYQAAVLAAGEVKEKYPHIQIAVVDSKGGAGATGIIVLETALAVQNGFLFDEIVKNANDMASHIEHVFTIPSLEWLHKGGRISFGTAIVGDILKIKPIIHLQNGLIKPFKKARGTKRALKIMVDTIEHRMKFFKKQIIAISHADDFELALELKKMLIDRLGPQQFMIEMIGSVLASHIGIGGVGVFFLNKKPKYYSTL